MESSLLELEENKNDLELIGKIFRALHTIKGSGAMFGFDEISAFTHEVETIFDRIRDGKLKVNKELIDLTLAAGDQVKKMFGSSASSAGTKENAEKLLISFGKYLPSEQNAPGAEPVDQRGDQEIAQNEEIMYRIRFKPSEDIFKTGTNPIFLLEELRALGECKILGYMDELPMLAELDPEACYVCWDIFLSTSQDENAIKDVFIFIDDSSELKIDVIDNGQIPEDIDYKKLGEILIERGDISTEELEEALKKQKRIGDVLVETGAADDKKIITALAEQKHVRNMREKRKEADSQQSIRVSSDKLDRLVNLVGEMVTVKSLLSQTARERNDDKLISIAEEVEHLTEELRENAMSIRMIPIGITFNKFRRLVRDLSNELGKEIRLVTEGADTELDKNVIEKLNDPLIHLIRNCIDHGIELPENREAAGKDRTGTVHLSAEHSGAHVLIKINDDGAGIDAEVIREKAIEKGLISPNEESSEKEIFAQIFVPGFSTAVKVSNVSGRGVGMDVVKRTIDSLRGSIEIESKKGVGTTIALKLPLTLAIIEGLLIKISGDPFIIPLTLVEECIELTRADVVRMNGRHIVNVRDELIPFIRLRERFNIDGEQPEIEKIVITKVEGFKVGFVVDEVIGEHQTVIKSLGRVYRDIEGVSGATILGDGSIALILDISKLAYFAEVEEKQMVESLA